MRKIKTISIPEIESALDSKLDKSNEVSKRILDIMEMKGWNQKVLADNMQKSEAEISKLLSGSHNFTLRTISKFEAVLGLDIIEVAKSKFETAKVISIGSKPVNTNGFEFGFGVSTIEELKDVVNNG